MDKMSSLEILNWVKSTLINSDSILFITAIATFVTSLANLFLIVEMRRQRAATSKPVLKILPKYIKATLKNNQWVWSETNKQRGVNLKFINFGAGPALNVKVLWDFDFEALIKTLKYFDPYNQKDFKYENSFLSLENTIHNIQNQTTVKIDAIPANKISEPDLLEIPFFYLDGFEKHTELGIINRPEPKDKTPTLNLPNFPEIFAEIKYQEINGAKLEQRFKILISLNYIGLKEGSETEREASISIGIEEVKVAKKPEQSGVGEFHY